MDAPTVSAGEVKTNVLKKIGFDAANLLFDGYAEIDFNHLACKNYPPAWDDAATGVPDNIVCNSLTTIADVEAGSLGLHAGSTMGYVDTLVMVDFLGEQILELGNTIDTFDFKGAALSHAMVKDGLLFHLDQFGDAVAYIDYNAADNQIRMCPRIETNGVQTQAISIYSSDDDYAGMLEGRVDDSDMYPGEEQTNCKGPRFTHERMALHPADYWTFPTSFSTNTTQLPQKSFRGKNTLFETYAVQPYWTQYNTVFQCSSFHQQLFSISANPHVPTGANDNLTVDDIFDININVPTALERTSCVCINKPTRFVPSGSHDEFPVPYTKSICEPNALTVRFGFTDQDKRWGHGFD